MKRHTTSEDVGKTTSLPLLSICMTGRDDDYMRDFKYRASTTINYISRQIARLGRSHQVELVVADWGSEVPLSRGLCLSNDAARISRFMYVPRSVVETARRGGNSFHTAMSFNAACRRGAGEFLMLWSLDTLITEHALDMLLRVLDGTLSLPVSPENAFMVIPRCQVPWQFMQRRPGLEEWDRYLLLNTGELDHDGCTLLNICSGAGGFVMHRRHWHKSRGIDEDLSGWGFSDIDFGLRIAQMLPWLSLSSIGVNAYHMEHPAVGGRVDALANKNPLSYNVEVQVNHDDWGLGNVELEEQQATLVAESTKVFRNEVSEESKAESLPTCAGEILTEITKPVVLEHVICSLKRFDVQFVEREDMEALQFLAWYSTHRYPRNYLEVGIRRGYAAAIVAAGCPAVEVYGIDKFEGVIVDHTAIHYVARMLRTSIGHRAYARFINGNIETALDRLKASFVGPFLLDLALVRGDHLGEHLREQVADLLAHITPGGALVITCIEPARLQSLCAEWREKLAGSSLYVSRSGSTAMILTNLAAASPTGSSVPITCSLDIASMLQEFISPTIVRRAVRALRQPRRYPEFAARFLVCGIRRIWPNLF